MSRIAGVFTRRVSRKTAAWIVVCSWVIALAGYYVTGAVEMPLPEGKESPSAAVPLSVGAARVDITPPAGTPLAGYGDRHGRPSTGVHDRLYARAVVVNAGGRSVAFVACDLIGMVRAIREQVSRAAVIDCFADRSLLICGTHTHSGTGAMTPEIAGQIACGRFHPKVRRDLVGKIVLAVMEAEWAARPAKFGFASTRVPQYQSNRRGEDVTRTTDPELCVLKFTALDGKPIATIANYTAHGTCLGPDNMLISGDYPGAFAAAMERKVGGVCLFTNGAEGDQAPHSPAGLRGFDEVKEIGEGLAGEAARLLPRIGTTPKVRLDCRTMPLRLPFGLGWIIGGTWTTVQAVGINDWVGLAVPGEMASQIGLQLKRKLLAEGFRGVSVIGLANDHLGYILTPEQMKEGGYEAAVSFYGRDLGPTIERALEDCWSQVGKVQGIGVSGAERRAAR